MKERKVNLTDSSLIFKPRQILTCTNLSQTKGSGPTCATKKKTYALSLLLGSGKRRRQVYNGGCILVIWIKGSLKLRKAYSWILDFSIREKK